MNKARRHELKMLKYKKRIELYGFKKELMLNPTNKANLYAFRSHGAPCSCSMCSHTKHSRKVKHPLQKLADSQIEIDPIFNEGVYDNIWDLI